MSATNELFGHQTVGASGRSLVNANRRSVQNIRLLDSTAKGSLQPDGQSIFDKTFDVGH